MATERREHRLALEILYAVEVGKAPMAEALEQAKGQVGVFGRGDRARAEEPYEPQYPAVDRRTDAPRPTDWAAVEAIVRGTLDRKAELQADIAAQLQRWKLGRLADIDRIILEIGAWELRYRPAAETAEVINHAVELARRLSTAQSAGFVNAILDALAKRPVPPAAGP